MADSIRLIRGFGATVILPYLPEIVRYGLRRALCPRRDCPASAKGGLPGRRRLAAPRRPPWLPSRYAYASTSAFIADDIPPCPLSHAPLSLSPRAVPLSGRPPSPPPAARGGM